MSPPDPGRRPRSFQLGSVIVFLGTAAMVVGIFLFDSPPRRPRETERYTAQFLVVPGQDELVPLPTDQPGDLREQPPIARELRWSAWSITATVSVTRLVPLRRSGKTFTHPGPEQYAQAGPDRGVHISFLAQRFVDHEHQSMSWPDERNAARIAELGGSALPMPDDLVARTLDALAVDVLEQSGDPTLADAVRARGQPLHQPTATFVALPFLALVVGAATVFAGIAVLRRAASLAHDRLDHPLADAE